MAKNIIKVEGVSKQYRLGTVGTGSLAHDLNRWWHKARGKEDPYLTIGEENDRSTKGKSDYVWALRDINFDVQQGDVLGIIGKNGAGKSTLLKLLSRTTAPTTGAIKMRGKIASLLEVGTGFHPELSGRDNIYLNGAILGMTRQEVARKFDEIVDFAGVERYVDTPVKRYSSGMYVRLAFAVAAHLEPDVLIVDEVLAVGDAEFQKKAIGKMQDVSKGEGRTILFVSHNMNAVRNLCTSGLIMNNGQVLFRGDIGSTLQKYEEMFYSDDFDYDLNYQSNGDKNIAAQILEIQVTNSDGIYTPMFDLFDPIHIKVRYEVKKELKGAVVTLSVNNSLNTIFLSFDTDENLNQLDLRSKGIYETNVVIPGGLLKADRYYMNFNIGIANVAVLDSVDKRLGFKVELKNKNDSFLSYAEKRPGVIAAPLIWNTSKL